MNPLDSSPEKHFDEVTALLYLERQLEPEQAREFTEHLASCNACGTLLRALEREGIWLREALSVDDESIPAHVIAAPQSSHAHWGWVAALGLCAAGAYTLWNGFIEPWMSRASEAGFSQGNVLTMLVFTGAFWKGWDAMRSLTEFLAMATLGTLAIWLLRKQWKRFTAIAFVMGALLCSLALTPAASAADVERGNPSYTLPAGQEVKTDLIVWAVRARIDGDVDGDLIVWSQNVTVNGHVKGDILGSAQDLRINGTVDGNVRAWAQTLSINGTIGKNVLGLTGVSYEDEKAKIGGTMTVLSGTAELNGTLGGDLLALTGNLVVNGSLGNDAMIRSGDVTIGPGAEIKGKTKYRGNRQPDVSPSAKLGSPIQVTLEKRGPDYSQPRYYLHQVLFWGASFLFGLAILFLAPNFLADATRAANRIAPAIGFGALFLFATPILAFIVCITIVGLGVGISAFLLYLIALYAAQVFVALWVGDKLLPGGIGFGPPIGKLALGLAILHGLRMLPYVGSLITLVILMWGLGALVLALHRTMRPALAPA
jgi:cytoskeletal protein CcmA (bactofilin family)